VPHRLLARSGTEQARAAANRAQRDRGTLESIERGRIRAARSQVLVTIQRRRGGTADVGAGQPCNRGPGAVDD
jgi:hypothetical protein